MLTEASLRGKKANLSRSLVSERVEMKPTSPLNWSFYGRSLDLLNKAEEAGNARKQAQSIVTSESENLL
jgi:hypothetical protein